MTDYPYEINEQTGLILPANFSYSPHQDARPQPNEVSLLVIHNISLPPGEFGTGDIANFFLGRLNPDKHDYFQTISALRVSAHLLIDRAGSITQFVPFFARAWHAGESIYQGRPQCNDYSIGIELEGTDDIPYEKAQYTTLAAVIKVLMQHYPFLTPDRIVGHSDIAPGRKTDPGPSFDWAYLKRMVL